MAFGTQVCVNKSAKSKGRDKEPVVICLGLIRYKEFKTDILMTLSVPRPDGESLETDCDTQEAAVKELKGNFTKIVGSFNVVDKDLFIM